MTWFKKLFGRSGASRELEDELAAWRIVTVENQAAGEFAVIRLRVARPQVRVGAFSTAVEITWKYGSDMPPADVNEKQVVFERALDGLSGDNGFSELVQVSTGRGAKEWLFYTSDSKRFTAEFDAAHADHEPYPVEISFRDDPDWTIWQQTLEAIKGRLT